ncbi:hypothetical protein PF005_g27877 [Phytophthora fragariae]|uniref:Major facilitator superfamily (MFS) profile domain-containing protein n=1 Tax=Phytophthora fragariae TaxID=53985 RepID=A0A6A3Q301_9STRA|nr:hypothetical protein PF003_g28216 [Phytophthora fragariae]KAE8929377.1 hypothetical protein PF009_g20504 [Phytophthora fragariae]KAE8992293.1 hypothetical protein PF011_g17604 [Phytophthora fragariae]KAE9067359.1 hypothetical protein PF010_g27492 [Phytophthora fragariae]KAE9067398.1 hypothetical protein PF007_g28085 [Phytophthora fragariae]
MAPHRPKEEKVMRDRGVVMRPSWYYIKLLFHAGFGEAVDSFILTYYAALIREDILQSSRQASFLGGAVFVGSVIGSFAYGSLDDKRGRRPVFMVTLVFFLLGLVTSITCAHHGAQFADVQLLGVAH